MVTTTAVSGAPPLSPYGTLHGSLFQYHRNLVAFESSPPPPTSSNDELYNNNDSPFLSNNKCILVGGLSDGLLPTPYTELLQEACHEVGWSLVQPLMSSSYTGFGHGSLERDSEELQHLLMYLVEHRSATQFSFVGHSTGCQNAIHLLKVGSSSTDTNNDVISKIKLVALQAPVSDREGAMMQVDEYTQNIETARQLVAKGNEQDEMMPRNAFWAPITAKRFLDLQEKGGADDFFSSDWTDEELQDRLGHVGKGYESTGLHVLAAFSGSDEYVPPNVDTRVLTERLCNAMNVHCVDRKVATALYLPNANHNLSQSEGDGTTFVEKVKEMLKRVTP